MDEAGGTTVTTFGDPFAAETAGYLAHCESARGAIRHELVARQLLAHLPDTPVRVVDIGGGAGHQALRLADLGHHVTIVDPSAAMLAEARAALDTRSADTRNRVTLLSSTAADAAAHIGQGSFDVVLCHGVLMYLDDSRDTVQSLVQLARPGGLLSILTKNGDAVAMRAGLEGRYGDAVDAMQRGADLGRLGVVTRAETLQDLADLLWDSKADVVGWFGVRVFSDHLSDTRPGYDFGELLEAEWLASKTDPYRHVGRLLHVIAQRR